MAEVKEVILGLSLTKPIALPLPEHLNLPKRELDTHYHGEYNFPQSIALDPKYSYKNGLLDTIMTAYNFHLPLRLCPEDILICFTNMVSATINLCPENFKNKFVDTDEKKTLIVDMDGLRSSVTEKMSLWDLTIEQWVEQIQNCVIDKDFVSNMICDFSCSTALDKIVSYGVVMDTMKAYFNYKCYSKCGIPSVKIAGTADDWKKLCSKIQYIATVIGGTLETYTTDKFIPIVLKLIDTKLGKPDNEWWSHMISHKTTYGSGEGTHWDGWLMKLFPTVSKNDQIYVSYGSLLDEVLQGITETPFLFVDLNNSKITHEMTLCAGFHGVAQDNDGTVQAIRGYFIADNVVRAVNQSDMSGIPVHDVPSGIVEHYKK